MTTEEAGQGAGAEAPAAETEGVDGESVITLGLLDAVHQNSAVSQRSLAAELGIALGLTNSYLKRCVRKGLVKVRTAPANRYAYYLTPKGFAEKSRLTARYLSGSFSFYRQARGQCEALLAACVDKGWRRIALYGIGDLAEIAILCAMRHKLDVAGVADVGANIEVFLNLPVTRHLPDLGAIDGVLLTEYKRPQASFEVLSGLIAPDRILIPDLLKITREGTLAASSEKAGS